MFVIITYRYNNGEVILQKCVMKVRLVPFLSLFGADANRQTWPRTVLGEGRDHILAGTLYMTSG